MRTETIISAYLNAEGRLGPFILGNVGEAPHSRGNRLVRQYDVFRHEMYRRANDYDRLRAAIPTVSIPSSWPANMLPTEPGVLTTTAKEGDPLVWVRADDGDR